MNNLAVEVTNIVNKYIDEFGMSTEMVCGVLDVVSYKVKQASYIVDEPAEAESGGGESPVSFLKETSPKQKEDS